MTEKTYSLRTITPFYGHGSNTKVPEIRPTEIKSLLRFTFRAVNAVSDIRALFDKESSLFGRAGLEASSRASGVRLKLTHPTEYSIIAEPLIFRKEKDENTDVKYIAPSTEFKLSLRTMYTNTAIDVFEKWFELSLALFGVGGRSRRARGSIEIAAPKHLSFNSRETILASLSSLLNECCEATFSQKNKYSLASGIIQNKDPLPQNVTYPYIKSIQVGQRYESWKSLLSTIDLSAHENDSIFTGSDNPRYASPIYVSAIMLGDGVYPIVVTLHEIVDRLRPSDNRGDKSANFVNAIL